MFLAGNGAAFFRRDDFLADAFDLVIETFDVPFQRIVLGNRGSGFCHIVPQRHDPIHQRAFVVEKCVHFHRCIVLSLSLFGGEFCASIQTDCQFRFVRFSGFGQANGVIAGNQARSAGATERNLRRWWNPRRLFPHAPGHAI